MADDVKIVVTAPQVEAEKPTETAAAPEVKVLTDQMAIISFIEKELLKIPGCRSRSLYSLSEGDRGYSRSEIIFKLTTDYTVSDEQIKTPWITAFNLRYWQHCPEAAKERKPSGWLKDNLVIEVSETVSVKFWSFKLSNECISVLREMIAVEKGCAATGTRKVSDFY